MKSHNLLSGNAHPITLAAVGLLLCFSWMNGPDLPDVVMMGLLKAGLGGQSYIRPVVSWGEELVRCEFFDNLSRLRRIFRFIQDLFGLTFGLPI